ncbi:ubiquitin carboxyl-terminal hydrolase 47-like isoform X2 [Toxotes jaculatrix]|nr:ubiquitin carboxyl-terminal hydrolase 47-like isoform X2 [Toxotes jaculatrix]
MSYRRFYYDTYKYPAESAERYHGLINQGATCYLNSVLQVLFMTKDFREAVKRHTKKNHDSESIDHHLTTLFDDLSKRTTHTFNITRMLGISREYIQQDAAECLEKILGSLTSTEASQLFQGQLIHKNTCSSCGKETKTHDPFWSLTLELVESDKKAYTVMDGLEKYFRPKEIKGPNQMYCDSCDAKADSTTEFVVKHHPEILTLLLKRFKFDFRRRENVKIKSSVVVPYTLQISEHQTYELYGYVEHYGSLKGGHYTATVRSQDDNEWYNFNDTFVRQLDYKHFQLDNNEKSHTAYLLFYRKKTIQKPAANTLTPDIGEASTPEHQEDKQEHYSLEREADKVNLAAYVKVKEDGETGANESEKAAGSGDSSDYERQDNRTAGDSEHSTAKTDQERQRLNSNCSCRENEEETEEGQCSGGGHGHVDNEEDDQTVKGTAEKYERWPQDNKRGGGIHPSKQNDQGWEKQMKSKSRNNYPRESSVETEREDRRDRRRDDKHTDRRGRWDRHGGMNVEDWNNGLPNVSQWRHQTGRDFGVDRQSRDKVETGHNEHTRNRDSRDVRHGSEYTVGSPSQSERAVLKVHIRAKSHSTTGTQ